MAPRKAWKDLSERTKKGKLAKGITPEANDAAYKRAKTGGWKGLSATTQKRYASKGVTAADYEAGASLKDARGHATAPEHNIWRKRAIAADILASLPEYGSLPPAEQEWLGKRWILGFMSKSKGPLEPIKIQDWRYGRPGMPDRVRYQTDEQINARMEFLAWLKAHPEQEMDEEDWKRYRDNYMASFTKQ